MAQTISPGKQVASMNMGVIDIGATEPLLEHYRLIAAGASRTAVVQPFKANGLPGAVQTLTVGTSALDAEDNSLWSGDYDPDFVGLLVLSVAVGPIYAIPSGGTPEVDATNGKVLAPGVTLGMVPAAFRGGNAQAVVQGADCVDLTFSLDTSAYADADLLADVQALDLARIPGGKALLTDLVILDEDDVTAGAIEVHFFSDSTSLGTENAAFSPTDAMMRNWLGYVPIADTDWFDAINCKAAHMTSKDFGNIVLEAMAGERNVYVALVARSARTHTASGLRGRFKVMKVD